MTDARAGLEQPVTDVEARDWFPKVWLHCTPMFITRGNLCDAMPRRDCECSGRGSHDHLADRNWAERSGLLSTASDGNVKDGERHDEAAR